MRYVDPAELVRSISSVLKEVVVPECGSRYALGQLWAAIGLLENLATRVDVRPAIALTEQDTLRRWLNVAEDTPDLRARARAAVAEPEVWEQPSRMAELHDGLAEIEETERALRRPTYFYKAFEA
jgi:hypothetical protein